jgi:hypothetical protein
MPQRKVHHDDSEVIVLDSKSSAIIETRPPLGEPVPRFDAETDEFMSHTPDGQPPSRVASFRGVELLVLAALVVAGGLLFLYLTGGTTVFILSLVLVAILFGAAFPAWRSAQVRHHEADEARENMREAWREEHIHPHPH